MIEIRSSVSTCVAKNASVEINLKCLYLIETIGRKKKIKTKAKTKLGDLILSTENKHTKSPLSVDDLCLKRLAKALCVGDTKG